MDKIKTLRVLYNDRSVGTMALHQNYLAAFEYDADWLSSGFSISPFSLPLRQQVYIPKRDPFDGLFGVFSDSLPDGWGRLLVDRYLTSVGINPFEISQMDRLSIVGKSGMGGLTYEPAESYEGHLLYLDDYDHIADECRKVLLSEGSSDLDDLFRLGGSSGGARPKILTVVDGEPWIIKFPSSQDQDDIGVLEYRYSECAKACGIEMAETRLFPSKKCGGYFGTKRFDRVVRCADKYEHIHMVSVSGLLETSHRIPNLDYNILMKLTLELTKEFSEVKKLYRLMCFNVFAHNRDDHSKNFSFLYNEPEQRWQLSPAYDLTFSYSIGGEHATSVNGNGKNPGTEDLLAVAKMIGINEREAKTIADEVHAVVHEFKLTYAN